jgi:hypothetical protein
MEHHQSRLADHHDVQVPGEAAEKGSDIALGVVEKAHNVRLACKQGKVRFVHPDFGLVEMFLELPGSERVVWMPVCQQNVLQLGAGCSNGLGNPLCFISGINDGRCAGFFVNDEVAVSGQLADDQRVDFHQLWPSAD